MTREQLFTELVKSRIEHISLLIQRDAEAFAVSDLKSLPELDVAIKARQFIAVQLAKRASEVSTELLNL